jgi:hypothetical protein
MSTYAAVLGAADSVRRAAWRAGGSILLAMGGASVAVAIGGLIFAGGGVILLPLALPPLAAGYIVVRMTPGARSFGFLVAALYGGFGAYAATYSMRGLTPPPGPERPPPNRHGFCACCLCLSGGSGPDPGWPRSAPGCWPLTCPRLGR